MQISKLRQHLADKWNHQEDYDLTELVKRKSTVTEIKEKFAVKGLDKIDLLVIMFMMYSFGIYTGIGYVSGLKSGNKFILSIEQASGIMFIVALCFMVAFIAALTAKVRKW